jgi:hypothetical protein
VQAARADILLTRGPSLIGNVVKVSSSADLFLRLESSDLGFSRGDVIIVSLWGVEVLHWSSFVATLIDRRLICEQLFELDDTIPVRCVLTMPSDVSFDDLPFRRELDSLLLSTGSVRIGCSDIERSIQRDAVARGNVEVCR